jgi:hypothetical protein
LSTAYKSHNREKFTTSDFLRLTDSPAVNYCPYITSRPVRRLELKGMVPDSGGW